MAVEFVCHCCGATVHHMTLDAVPVPPECITCAWIIALPPAERSGVWAAVNPGAPEPAQLAEL